MAKNDVEYIDYSTMKESYTVNEACELLGLTKKELKELCEMLKIKPRRDEIGDWILVKYEVRKIHNYLYHAAEKDDDPWA